MDAATAASKSVSNKWRWKIARLSQRLFMRLRELASCHTFRATEITAYLLNGALAFRHVHLPLQLVGTRQCSGQCLERDGQYANRRT